MERELIICIPGPWRNRSELVSAVVSATRGEFMFAANILAHPSAKDHAELDFCDPDEQLEEAFRIAGQGRLTAETQRQIADHQGLAFLHFPLNIASQIERLLEFTDVISRSGGFAVKLESSGIAHEWERWFSLLRSDNPFDIYCAAVVLIGDESYYYSCGMHHFDLPESQVPRTIPPDEAAGLINQFNHYQITARPKLASGHTFSLSANSPKYRINLIPDDRHPADDLFHNPHGVWELTRA